MIHSDVFKETMVYKDSWVDFNFNMSMSHTNIIFDKNWTLWLSRMIENSNFDTAMTLHIESRGRGYVCWESSVTWWCHQMETFSELLAIFEGNSLVIGKFPTQRPVMRSFGVFFDLCLNKVLSKQSWGWWFHMPSHSLRRHCNECIYFTIKYLT